MAVRRGVLEQIGGLEALGDALGRRLPARQISVREPGIASNSAPYVVHTTVAERDLRALWLRELRWARTIRAVRARRLCGIGHNATHCRSPPVVRARLRSADRGALRARRSRRRCASLLHYEARETFAPGTSAQRLGMIPLRDLPRRCGLVLPRFSAQAVALARPHTALKQAGIWQPGRKL